MLQRIALITRKHKIIRGMASYAILWPLGNIAEQTFIEHRNWRTYDWKKTFKFGLWGAFFVGPTLYMWMRLAYIMWPRTDIRSSMIKAITEQISYDPMAITCFLFGMSLLEGNSVNEAKSEEETTMSVMSLESDDSYLSKEEVDIETEKLAPAGTGENLLIGDIEKLKKVAEILQTVSQTVIPVLIQNNEPGNSESETIQNKTRGLQLIHGLKREVDELTKTKS